jgi:indolepyruvate ferredoxin oxidoreductase beta subunit
MTNILIVGVGGQGSLLASRILGHYYASRGLDVKLSEVHGMSQRGGSVVTYIRAGERVDSPLIEPGCADVIISFELLEGARYLKYLKKDGILITSTQQIDPMPVITGAASYPEDIPALIKNAGARAVYIDALGIALEAGNPKSANVAVLGAASVYIGGDGEEWEKAVSACVPQKYLEQNLTAFNLGKKACL